MFTQDEIARRAYEKAEKFRRDQGAMLSFAKKEGAAQMLKALAALKMGTSPEKIAADTGLSLENIRMAAQLL